MKIFYSKKNIIMKYFRNKKIREILYLCIIQKIKNKIIHGKVII